MKISLANWTKKFKTDTKLLILASKMHVRLVPLVFPQCTSHDHSPGVIAGVDRGETSEGHVIRAGGVLGGVIRLALIVRVVCHQVTPVHVG